MWAAIDLLAMAARHNARENAFRALDSTAAARRDFWTKIDAFKSLLAGEEAPLQGFLTDHPALISPTLNRIRPKVPLRARVTDFVIREATGDYLLIGLEAPTTADGRSLSSKLGRRCGGTLR